MLICSKHAAAWREGSWIDLKLDLWESLADAIHKCRRKLPRGLAGRKKEQRSSGT
jgi:hypothetical protein